jgi:fatty acid CoA ligase FadD21
VIESTNSRHRDKKATHKFDVVKGDVTSVISNSHGLGLADLVVVERGSIPIMPSAKVRRAARVEQYRRDQFARLGARQDRAGGVRAGLPGNH